jgi:hypothetical protein
VGDASTGVAGHVFNPPSSRHDGSLGPPLFHFDPFGTEFREPGRISHPIYKDPSSFRRSSWRPRASLDFTVPTLMFNVFAISS